MGAVMIQLDEQNLLDLAKPIKIQLSEFPLKEKKGSSIRQLSSDSLFFVGDLFADS